MRRGRLSTAGRCATHPHQGETVNRPSPRGEHTGAGHLPAATVKSEPPCELSARAFPLESGVEREHRKRPCTTCPLADRHRPDRIQRRGHGRAPAANGRPGAEAPVDAPIVTCHRDRPGTEHAMRWCAGFLAEDGEEHLGIRLALAFQALPPQAVHQPAGWPELYPDLDALVAARAEQLGLPELPEPCEERAGESPTTMPTALNAVGSSVPGGTHHDNQ
ncbi:DUF6283 family protein [Streptomyces sp. NPDC102441]|uniref:DUF6283 family protein n=1 Tax=Streptomyces sp. NPDC102441 TaxID=3366176 RepID=UPI00380B5EFB